MHTCRRLWQVAIVAVTMAIIQVLNSANGCDLAAGGEWSAVEHTHSMMASFVSAGVLDVSGEGLRGLLKSFLFPYHCAFLTHKEVTWNMPGFSSCAALFSSNGWGRHRCSDLSRFDERFGTSYLHRSTVKHPGGLGLRAVSLQEPLPLDEECSGSAEKSWALDYYPNTVHTNK